MKTNHRDDLIELIADIEAGYHIPFKFRKTGFVDKVRARYLSQLRKALKRLDAQKDTYETR